MHPKHVDLHKVDAKQTIPDEIASKLYDARCEDNGVQATEGQRESFLSSCRQKSYEGKLILYDMALGYKCA